MNFFGHALVAERDEATRGAVRAEFVLGSMLPDFASMLRLRPPRATSATLEAGLRFHHRTDAAFHGSRSFLEFSGQASKFLCDEQTRHPSSSPSACALSWRVVRAWHWTTRGNPLYGNGP